MCLHSRGAYRLVLICHERFPEKIVFILETNLNLKGREERHTLSYVAADKTGEVDTAVIKSALSLSLC